MSSNIRHINAYIKQVVDINDTYDLILRQVLRDKPLFGKLATE
jgi:hypothetical protein